SSAEDRLEVDKLVDKTSTVESEMLCQFSKDCRNHISESYPFPSFDFNNNQPQQSSAKE
ncbi:hypothetical protein P7K49_000282, partial [Saguinus oedipus]